MNSGTIPTPTVERLCAVYGLLDDLVTEGITRISSAQLGERLGESAHTIRKDFGYLPPGSFSSSGYAPGELKKAIAATLGLKKERTACIVGLGRLGQAMLAYPGFSSEGIVIRAGFDSDTNKLEILTADVPLLPSYRIAEYVKENCIELGIIAVPSKQAQITADRLIEGGIQGLVNFSSPVAVPETIRVRQISVLDELRMLAGLIYTSERRP